MSIDEGSLPATHIHKVIEEAILIRHLIEQETQRSPRAREDVAARHVAALVRDAQCGQTEASGRNARYGTRVVAGGEGAILHLSRRRAGLPPEVEEDCALDIIEKLVVGERRWSRGVAGGRAAAGRPHRCQSSNGNASIVLPNSARLSRRLKDVFGADELMKVRFRTSATEAQLKRFSQCQEE